MLQLKTLNTKLTAKSAKANIYLPFNLYVQGVPKVMIASFAYVLLMPEAFHICSAMR